MKVVEHTWMHMFSLADLFVKKKIMSVIHLFPIQVCTVWWEPSICKYTFDWQVNKSPPPPTPATPPKISSWNEKKKKQISKFLVCELKRYSIHLNRHSNGNLYFQGEARGEKQYKNRGRRWDAWDKCSGLVHWEDPEDSDGEGGGRGFGMGNTCNSMADSCQCMTKPTEMLWILKLVEWKES